MSSWVFFGVLLTVALALAARAILARSHPPLHPMTAPSVEPFLLRYARQAAKERRVVWIRYVEPDKEVIEEKVEAGGKEIEEKPRRAPKPTKVIDLVSVLQKSLEQTGAKQKTKSRSRAKKAHPAKKAA